MVSYRVEPDVIFGTESGELLSCPRKRLYKFAVQMLHLLSGKIPERMKHLDCKFVTVPKMTVL